jgi:1-aminocyclopropane-1-carboxylate deaminase/D-cysteine desulfhydrase-like pyridoxal-dependent ACC family enzyme
VPSRDDRAPRIAELADRLRAEGRKPYAIPVGASMPLGALGFVAAVAELLDQIPAPDVIVHATSSGGTQAGLVAGCRLLGLSTRVVGISADAKSAVLQAEVRAIASGVFELLALDAGRFTRGTAVEVDDAFAGDGYGVPTDASREAIDLAARCEALFLDPVYTAKAMAGLIANVRQQRFTDKQTVVFWHTGGQVALFA